VTFWKNNFGQQLLFISNKVFRSFSFSKKVLSVHSYFIAQSARCYSPFSYHVAIGQCQD
jgi:hypothetical protein